MKCSRRLFAIVAAGALLAACGQMGPLVLPDHQKPKRTMPQVPGFRRGPEQRPAAPEQPAGDAAPVAQPAETPAASSPR